MSDPNPPQPPADDVPPSSGQVPPQYGSPTPPPYGTQPPPYGTPPQAPYGTPPQAPYGATPPPYGAPAAPLDDAQTRQWAGLAHLGGILGFLPSLIIWLVYRERSAFVGQEARKALNFQLTVLIGYVASSVLAGIVPFIGLLAFPLWIIAVIFSVQGYQAVQRGQAYTYPFTLDLIK
ncbi:DUF4870 domain-containing protein [Pengzhenrongella phosphoraccumulans]|uniref:DUF4870 domain-containing protein n=1 Tax=Pengzhenrongella phosphoraccumulans TaxID=3114394 RepID=UPI00388E7776